MKVLRSLEIHETIETRVSRVQRHLVSGLNQSVSNVEQNLQELQQIYINIYIRSIVGTGLHDIGLNMSCAVDDSI